jgi:hypothetical protein
LLDDIWFNYFWCHYDPQCEGAPAFPRRSELIHPEIWHRGGIQNEAAVSIPLTPSRRAHLCGSQPAESPQMCTELHGLRHQLVSQLTEHNWNIKQSNNRWIWWWTLYKKQVATSHYYLYIISPRPRPTHGQVAAQRNSVAPFGFACGVHPTTYRRDTPGHVDPKDSHRPSDRGTVVVRMDGSWGERQDGKLSYPLVPWFPIPLYILLIIYNYIYIMIFGAWLCSVNACFPHICQLYQVCSTIVRSINYLLRGPPLKLIWNSHFLELPKLIVNRIWFRAESHLGGDKSTETYRTFVLLMLFYNSDDCRW